MRLENAIIFTVENSNAYYGKEKRKRRNLMQIHRIAKGESVFGVARRYGVSPTSIIEVNGLENPDVLAVGQELLILTPRRVYTARGGDTVGIIARRFNLKKEEIYAANPSLLCDERLYEGKALSLGYGDTRLGMAASNGYVFAGCSEEAILRSIPYLTYLTVASVAIRGSRVESLFNGQDAVKTARKYDKVPILRVFLDGCADRYREGKALSSELIELAREGGYSGLVLSVPDGDVDKRIYEEFILGLRKEMIGSGLILFTEAVCGRDYAYADLADGCVLSCAQPSEDRALQERRAFERYAEEAESSKTFMDVASFAVMGGEYADYQEAVKTAAKVGAEIKHDRGRGVCNYSYHSRGGREISVEFESLENIKAKLELIGELGYMGISFDVGRTPIAHLMAYSALFSGIGYTSIFGLA